ncbi:hypothetical protein [Sulfuricurvum sp.]|uniref:hypothetical protein n=1 Tax=Sulfuricurvum sp. TaxID=2025608 RepID=UPI00261459B9|nr:hypothetical protein [Sulfuricurvum sp.]MDD2266727.1 hypothetical protein [Sulfuricurvum sp.]MDD2783895.1 hypothetical protein [Sulfuricurvum sp.]
MKKILSFCALLLLGIIIFLPKSNIYYSAEEAFSTEHLYLSGEKIHDRFLYLDVRDASLLLDSMPIGTIDHIRIIPLIFFNRATITSLNFSGEFASLFPEGIEYLTFTYSLLHPLTVVIEGEGGFGPVHGEIDLKNERLEVIFEPSQVMRAYPLLLAKLHKSDKGLVYETSF